MSAPDFLVHGGDGTAILLGLPLMAAAAYVGNKIVDGDAETQAKVMIGAGCLTLAVAFLFAGACDGDKRGLCRMAPEMPKW